MPKTPSFTPQKLLKILQGEGFVVDHVTGSHYILFHPASKRRVTVPFHRKDLPKGTLFSILKSAGIQHKKLNG